MALGQMANATKADLFAFGSRSGPRPPRHGIDYVVDALGMVGPEQPPFPAGASLFADPQQAPLRGHFHRLAAGTTIPAGLEIVADGIDVHSNSIHPATHHTLFPITKVAPHQFVSAFLALPWQYSGRKS
jgi:hypothetical protein